MIRIEKYFDLRAKPFINVINEKDFDIC